MSTDGDVTDTVIPLPRFIVDADAAAAVEVCACVCVCTGAAVVAAAGSEAALLSALSLLSVFSPCACAGGCESEFLPVLAEAAAGGAAALTLVRDV